MTDQGWADRMFDASAKLPPAGILQGNLHFPGSFDACLAVSGPEFQGKMAMLTLGTVYGADGARAARPAGGKFPTVAHLNPKGEIKYTIK